MILEPKKSSKNKLFEETSYQAIQAAHRKKWAYIGIFLVVAAVIAILVISDLMMSRAQNKVALEYASIEQIYQKETTDFQEKYKSSQPPQGAEPNYSKSMPLFSQFAVKHNNNPYGWQAAIRSATYFIAQKNPKQAQDILESILPHVQKFPLVQIKVRTTLASVYAAQNENAKALEQLNFVEKISDNPAPNQAKLLKAQILFVSGNKKEATQILNQIISATNTGDSKSSSEDQTRKQAQLWLSYI